MSRIGVDLDGTLCYDRGIYTDEVLINAKPRYRIIDYVNFLYDRGEYIIIWTGRPESMRQLTQEWLNNYGVKHNELVMDKLRVDLYIDENKKLLPIIDQNDQ